MGARYPTAIVWGLETQIGLSIVRELGRFGVPVLGLCNSPNDIGARSRYLTYVVSAKPRGTQLLAQIRALGDSHGARVILAISEENNRFLAEQRQNLGVVKPLVPTLDALATVLDKQVTLKIAERHGIRVPRSTAISRAAEIDTVAATFPYPVVLKWTNPHVVMPLLAKARIEFLKAQYCYSPDELRAGLHRFDGIGMWPLVQEYCSGYGLGQFFFMHDGIPLRRFQHRRIAEWPPEGGFSSVCDAVPLALHSELQEQSIAMLRAIGWEGVAMVEYRFDPVRNQAMLMEINGRFWGSFPLAVHCGAGFSLYAYFATGLGHSVRLAPPRDDLRCRMVATEIKRILRIVFHPKAIHDRRFRREPIREIVRFIADFLRPRIRYYVFTKDDLRPFLQDLCNFVRDRIAVNRQRDSKSFY